MVAVLLPLLSKGTWQAQQSALLAIKGIISQSGSALCPWVPAVLPALLHAACHSRPEVSKASSRLPLTATKQPLSPPFSPAPPLNSGRCQMRRQTIPICSSSRFRCNMFIARQVVPMSRHPIPYERHALKLCGAHVCLKQSNPPLHHVCFANSKTIIRLFMLLHALVQGPFQSQYPRLFTVYVSARKHAHMTMQCKCTSPNPTFTCPSQTLPSPCLWEHAWLLQTYRCSCQPVR